MSVWMAASAARLISSGAAKSGKPCARLTAPASVAMRDISRITDSVNPEARLLTNRGLRFRISTGRTEVFWTEVAIERAYHRRPRRRLPQNPHLLRYSAQYLRHP